MRIRHHLAGGAALAAVLALTPVPAGAVVDPGPAGSAAETARHDVRRAGAAVRPTDAQLAAVRDLVRAAGAGVRVSWDPRFGTPRTIRADGGWLTGPRSGDAVAIARSFIDANRDAFGFSAADVAALAVVRDHELVGTGTRVINFAQSHAGLRAVRGGHLGVAVAADGRVLSYAGAPSRGGRLLAAHQLTPGQALQKAVGRLAPGVAYTALAAGERAGFQVFAKGPFAGESYVQKAVFPVADGVRPAYRVLFVKGLDAAWDTVVDAATGATLYQASLVAHDAEGTVYENYPGAPAGGSPVIRPFGPTAQSPSGYVDPTGLAGLAGPTTVGNNANAYANYSNYLVPADQGPRPVSPTGQFNYAYGANWARTKGQTVPPSYALDLDAAATNLFWHHNRIHDEFYALGFTESAGNFQLHNGDRGGQGGDPILGLVHAGAATGGSPTYTGRDNAYMLTLPDGIPPWSGMFLWEPINDAFEGPHADGNFDASVIEHEYAHGLSNRYVGGEDNALNTHQSGSMGEAWGDWYALNYLYGKGLAKTAVVGQYATGNDTRGIRNWDYDANPTGFGDIGYDLGGAEVHSDGEIWTAMLWDVRKALVARFGEATGGEMAARIVTDAMPLSPPDPSFVDMRDAMRTALDNRYHSRPDYDTVVDLVFGAFAKRGLGQYASTRGGEDTDPVPSYTHQNPARNGTLTGTVVNAGTGRPIAGARVMLGVFEARVTPLTTTSAEGGFGASVTAGTYPVTVAAPGFGARTVTGVRVTAGTTTALRFALAPNLAATADGASVVSATATGAERMLDDTEASSWTAAPGTGHAVIKLAAPAEISSIQVSAFTTARFEGLRGFTLQTSTDGVTWRTALARPDAFGYQTPRPTAPDLHYKRFGLGKPVQAQYLRFWTDSALGETKTGVQVAELQVFARDVQGVEPLPPSPPDEPVSDAGTIVAGNPSTGTVDDATGVTATAFRTACAVPPAPAQGADGWVTELPASFGDGAHRVEVRGGGATPYDLDLYFYDESCALVGSAASSAADESGTLPSGTRYVLTQLWSGAAVPITLTATDPR
ncbi:Fungalysin/Thermolysin Propeptide Motif [Micromonospora pattaloongensis]|uniref:Fungalysin/Thermolysin Propeptide Motif n=1 Tax=Micromonospora pattaloongensis TaxID=405436 RepID=A0A1H3JCW7_9ACTN|nr:M36 family metallopeptidase [Micromonospora pattaloongensis]SDY37880.1 Fungalysin/Thermolysin Propeptide Motif [Micromonospora pattaloongensis]